MPRGLRHVALSISFLSPMARRPDAFFATNIASLIFLPDLRFLALTSFQSLNRPSLSSGSSSRISLLKQSFSVSRPRLRPSGNIHSRSRLLLTNKTRPRFVATSFDDFAITVRHRLCNESSALFYSIPCTNKGAASSDRCLSRRRGPRAISRRSPLWVNRDRNGLSRPLRFSPGNGHSQCQSACLKRANSGSREIIRSPHRRAAASTTVFQARVPLRCSR
jgi:hypothetical protein